MNKRTFIIPDDNGHTRLQYTKRGLFQSEHVVPPPIHYCAELGMSHKDDECQCPSKAHWNC